MKIKAKTSESRGDLLVLMERVKLFNQALKIHFEEISKAIHENYQILASTINKLLNIRETLLEIDLNNGVEIQKNQKLRTIQGLQLQIKQIRESLSILDSLKNDIIWKNQRELALEFPKRIVLLKKKFFYNFFKVHYFDLNNRVYQINRQVHLNVNRPVKNILFRIKINLV